jgi:hypothetical protein
MGLELARPVSSTTPTMVALRGALGGRVGRSEGYARPSRTRPAD